MLSARTSLFLLESRNVELAGEAGIAARRWSGAFGRRPTLPETRGNDGARRSLPLTRKPPRALIFAEGRRRAFDPGKRRHCFLRGLLFSFVDSKRGVSRRGGYRCAKVGRGFWKSPNPSRRETEVRSDRVTLKQLKQEDQRTREKMGPFSPQCSFSRLPMSFCSSSLDWALDFFSGPLFRRNLSQFFASRFLE